VNAFGWVRSRFRFLSFFLIVSLFSPDILWANPASLGSSVEQSVYPSFFGFGQVEKIFSPVFKAGSFVVYHIQNARAFLKTKKDSARIQSKVSDHFAFFPLSREIKCLEAVWRSA